MRPRRNYSMEALVIMLGFGLVIGLVFPIVVNPFVQWIPGRKTYFGLLCLFAGLTVGGVSYAIAHFGLIRRVSNMAEVLNETCIKEGDLTFRIPVESRDSIGKVAERFNENIGHMQSIVAAIKEAKGSVEEALANLNAGVTESQVVVQNFEGRTVDLETHLLSLESTMAEVLTQSTQLSASTQEASSAILEQQSNIQQIDDQADEITGFIGETASALEELKASIRQVSNNASEMSSSAQSARDLVGSMARMSEDISSRVHDTDRSSRHMVEQSRGGVSSVQEVAASMDQISQKGEEISALFQDLHRDSESIGKIISVMEDIGEQTGLLALNASIIAAQAKEEGRSFAVVASEIRDLSDRTSLSARDVGRILQGIQAGIERATNAMAENTDLVTKGVTKSREAEAALEAIMEMIDQSQTNVESIEELVRDQTGMNSQVTGSMDSVYSLTNSVAGAMNEQSGNVEQISLTAHRMNELSSSVKRALSEQRTVSAQISRTTESFDGLAKDISVINRNHKEQVDRVREVMENMRHLLNQEKAIISEVGRNRDSTGRAMTDLSQEIDRFVV